MAANASVTNTFVAGTAAVAAQVNTNFSDILTWINTNVTHLDGSKAFTAIPSGPAGFPSSANQLANKAYVDALVTACTSSTRPSSPAYNTIIWETDKSRLRIWSGTAWQILAGPMEAIATGSHTVASGTSTLSFATEVLDTDTFFTAGGSTFTIPESGLYAITVQLVKTSGNDFYQGFGMFTTVTAAGRSYIYDAFAPSPNNINFTIVERFAATNTVSMTFTNNSSGSTTFTSRVQISRVGSI